MNIESHLESLKESVRKIQEAVPEGLISNQRSIGFHTSAAAADMFEIILHQGNLIDPGFVVKHEWFNSHHKIKEKFSFDFPRKDEIISLVTAIESMRNKLCYGKRQTEEVLEKIISHFNALKQIFQEVTTYEL